MCRDITECNLRCKALGPYFCSSMTQKIIRKYTPWFTNNEAKNPVFYDFLKIWVQYCSSDIWRGTRGKSAETGNRYFYGKYIVKALKKSLIKKFQLNTADVAVLTGSSAGGLGAWMNCDDFFSGMPSTMDARCVVDSGAWIPWWLPPPSCLVNTLQWFKVWHEMQGIELNSHCVKDHATNKYVLLICGHLSTGYSYVKRPLFIMGVQIDIVFIMYYFPVLCPFTTYFMNLKARLADWRQNIRAKLIEVSTQKPEIGYYFPNCPGHMLHYNVFTVIANDKNEDITPNEALKMWMDGSNEVHLIGDTCRMSIHKK